MTDFLYSLFILYFDCLVYTEATLSFLAEGYSDPKPWWAWVFITAIILGIVQSLIEVSHDVRGDSSVFFIMLGWLTIALMAPIALYAFGIVSVALFPLLMVVGIVRGVVLSYTKALGN